MPRQRRLKKSKPLALGGLLSADELRWQVATGSRYAGMTDAELGAELGLTAGFVGMVMSGTREPSTAFLEAIGFERINVYRKKGNRK